MRGVWGITSKKLTGEGECGVSKIILCHFIHGQKQWNLRV